MSTIVGVIISLGTAYWAKSFRVLWIICRRYFHGSTLPCLQQCSSMFIWWITPNGAFWGLVAGMLSSFTLYLAVKFSWFNESIITMSSVHSDMAAKLLACLVGLGNLCRCYSYCKYFTKKKPKEELIGLVKGLTKENHDKTFSVI